MIDYTEKIKKHFDILMDNYDGMLPSELLCDGKPYIGDRDRKFKRVYRNIDAPDGRTFYWDQPLFESAKMLGGKYADFAKRATKHFLKTSRAKNGMYLWGNHYYYSDAKNGIVKFVGEEEPVLCSDDESGMLHELRPIMPDFDALRSIDQEATDCYIYQLLKMHTVDEKTGEFNRHADNKRGYAFLESGGILARIACLLYSKNQDMQLLNLAKGFVGFSYSFKDKNTGLIENCPTQNRWDKYNATTETCHWALSLLECYSLTNDKFFLDIATNAVESYIKYSYDKNTGRYFGCLDVKTGVPLTSENKETIYMPDIYSNLWQQHFPTHDYLFSLAESGIRLYRINGNTILLKTAVNIAKQIYAEYSTPTFAENYGYAIELMKNIYLATDDEKYLNMAEEIAKETVNYLSTAGLFKGHPEKNSCSAVDGIGQYFKALLELSDIKA